MYRRFSPYLIGVILWVQLLLIGGYSAPVHAADVNVSGTVLNEAGQPQANVELVVLQAQQEADPQQPQWREAARVTADESGRFAVSGLEAGIYRVDLGEAARHSTTNFIIQIYVNDNEAVVHGAAQAQTAAITGLVTDQSGAAASQVAVSLYQLIARPEYTYEQLVRRTLTDATGHYAMPNVAAGRYKLHFADALYPERFVPEYYVDAYDPWAATEIELVGADMQIDAQLTVAGSLSGQVSNAQGQPLPNIMVGLLQGIDDGFGYTYWNWIKDALTLEDGLYSFDGLIPGNYRISYADTQWPPLYAPEFYNNAPNIDAATDITVTSAVNTGPIAVQLAPASQISGKVTDASGAPIEGIVVTVYSYSDEGGIWLQNNQSSATDSTGAYTVYGLPAGVYHLEFADSWMWPARYQAEFYNDAVSVESATDVVVGEGVVVNDISVQLAKMSAIRGQVTGENGQPLVGASVQLFSSYEGGWYLMNNVETDGAGTYEVAGLSAGTYRMGFAYSSSGQPVEFYNNAATVDVATDIVVAGETIVADINAQLPTPGRIDGMVTDTNGAPLTNITVNAIYLVTDSTGADFWMYENSALTDERGLYALDKLSAGAYYVEFVDYANYPRLYSTSYYSNSVRLSDAMTVSVAAGAVITNVNAQLASVGAISGQVVDANGVPVAEMNVAALRFVSDPMGNSFWSETSNTQTDSMGMYTLEGLDVDSYRVKFQDYWQPRRYAVEYYDNSAELETATDVVVGAGARITDINAQVDVGTQVLGNITNEQGAPLAGIYVSLMRASLSDISVTPWEYYGEVMTGEDGSYVLTGLSKGVYRIGFYDFAGQYQAEFYDNVAEIENGTNIVANGSQDITGINAQLAPTVTEGEITTAQDLLTLPALPYTVLLPLVNKQ